MELTTEILKELSIPFSPEKVHFKVQTNPNAEGRALVVAYLDARDVMDRLDDVVGGKWSDAYYDGASGKGVQCSITICGVTRSDVGIDDNETEPEKTGYSDSFKRAAVKFGVGRNLYRLPKMWATVTTSAKGTHYLSDAEEERLRDIYAATLRGVSTYAASAAPKENKPAPVAPTQLNKLKELYFALYGGDKAEVGIELDNLFLEKFKHNIAAGTYGEAAILAGELSAELQSKNNPTAIGKPQQPELIETRPFDASATREYLNHLARNRVDENLKPEVAKKRVGLLAIKLAELAGSRKAADEFIFKVYPNARKFDDLTNAQVASLTQWIALEKGTDNKWHETRNTGYARQEIANVLSFASAA